MRQKQSYNIEPSGLVKGGQVSYSADTDSGVIQYSAQVRAGFGFLSKTFSYSGTYSAAPSLFLSANLPAAGQSITVGPLTFTTQVYPVGSYAVVGSVMNLKGMVTIDSSKPFISIVGGHVNATVAGKDINLVLTLLPPVLSLREFLKLIVNWGGSK